LFKNKSPWIEIGPAPGAYIQARDFIAIMALLFVSDIKKISNELMIIVKKSLSWCFHQKLKKENE
jgi:hypothetical protein